VRLLLAVSSLHDLVDQQKLAGDDGSAHEHLALDHVEVVNSHLVGTDRRGGGGGGGGGGKVGGTIVARQRSARHGGRRAVGATEAGQARSPARFSGVHIEARVIETASVCLLQLDEGLLRIKAAVLGQCLGDDGDGVGKREDAELGFAGNALCVLQQVRVERCFDAARAVDERTVGDGVAHRLQAIVDGVFDLLDAVLAGSSDEKSDAFGNFDTFDESEFVVAKAFLVHEVSVAQHVGSEIVEAVDGSAAAREHQALHVAALGAAEADHALLGHHVER
jgi:hypothetical protein